eukprot:2802042-Amphidinium_carterae.1
MACPPPATCMLSDHVTAVPGGWYGRDAGSNWCNSCSCLDGGLECTEMFCGCTCDGGEGIPVCESCQDGGPIDGDSASALSIAPLSMLVLLLWSV